VQRPNALGGVEFVCSVVQKYSGAVKSAFLDPEKHLSASVGSLALFGAENEPEKVKPKKAMIS